MKLQHSSLAFAKRLGIATCLAGAFWLPLAGCDDDTDVGANDAVPPGGQAAVENGEDASAEESAEAQVAGFTEDGKSAQGVQTAEAGEEAVKIQKTLPEQIRLGTPMTYQIDVNPSEDVSGIIIREELPDGFEFESSTPEAQLSQDGRTLTFRMSDVRSGQAQQIQIKGTPQKLGSLEACTTYELERGTCAVFEVVNPQLRLTKQGPETAGICEPVTYTYVIRNEGDTSAENVTIYDRLPEGLMVMEGNREVKFEIGTLAAGQEASRDVQVVAEQAMQQAGSYAYAESDLDEVRSQRVVTAFLAPQLEVQAQAMRPFEYIGKTASFRVTVRNTGKAAAPATVVHLEIDGTGELAGINGQVTGGEAQLAAAGNAQDAQDAQDAQQEDTVEMTEDGVRLGTLAAGESRTFTVEVDAEDAGRINLSATAVAVCDRTDRALAQAQAAARLQVRALSAMQVYVVDKQDPVKVGEETVYELSVLNEGSGAEQNVTIVAQLPEGASFVSAEGPSEVTAEGRNLNFAAVEQLPPGESATWYIRVRADDASGSVKFTANVTSDRISEAVTTSEPTRLY